MRPRIFTTMKTSQHHGEPTYFFGTDNNRFGITPRAGHLRIEYRAADGQWQSPYSLSPWTPDQYPELPPLLQVLRGDFFCFPFGVTEGLADPHGESANREWTLVDSSNTSVSFAMDLQLMPGRVSKRLDYDPAALLLRQQHVIEGVDGLFNYGHHAILQIPQGEQAVLSASPIRFAQVYPNGFAAAADGEKSALKDGARFTALDAVEMADGGTSTLATYPVRPACEDLVMFTADSSDWAWNAVFMQGCLWISFRKVMDLPSTLYWMSNGGRPQAPWNGTHTDRIGIEDVCSYFHDGAHVSRQDLLKDQGIATARQFQPDQPTTIQHWQCVIPTDLKPCRIEQVKIAQGKMVIHPEGAEPITVRSTLVE